MSMSKKEKKYSFDKANQHRKQKVALPKKMKFFIKDFFSKCDQIRSIADLVTFATEIFNGKLHFLYSFES